MVKMLNMALDTIMAPQQHYRKQLNHKKIKI